MRSLEAGYKQTSHCAEGKQQTCPISEIPDADGPMSAVLSPLGTLTTLPRELRDDIYSLIVAQDGRKYLFHNDKIKRSDSQGRKKWIGDLAVLETSTLIRQEALAKHERSDIPFVDHLSHISLAFDVSIDDDDWLWECHIPPEEHDKILAEKDAAPISFFTGTDILRDSCTIEIGSCSPKLILLLESPFFHAISQLTGFKSVTVIYDSDKRIWQAHDPDSNARIQLFPDFATLVEWVTSKLKPTLGASSSEKIAKYDPQWPSELRGEVTFHPQDHLAERRVQQESSSRPGGAALAFSKHTIKDDSEG